jgi:hypothetical protein
MRQRGTGSIYKQKGSKVYWMKYHVHGKPRRESTGKRDYSDALDVLKLKVSEVNLNGSTLSGTLTIRQLVQAKFRKNRVEALRDLYNPEARWKLHLEPFFGNVKVKDYSSDLTMQYIERRKREGASGSSIDKEIQVVRGAFHYGMEVTPPLVTGIPYFPMTGEDNVRETFIDNEADKEKLRKAAVAEGPWMVGALEIGLTYGWRLRSLLKSYPMKVKDVDLLRDLLHVGMTKNGEANTVPLIPRLKAALLPLVRGKNPEDFLFTRADGSQVKGYRKAWPRVLKAAGLNPKLWVHDLRRTARVAMADRNMDERWAMELMGHKTRCCSERYNIVNMETRRKAAAMLEQPAPQAQPQAESGSQPQQQPKGQDGHTSGIAVMPKPLADGSQVQ